MKKAQGLSLQTIVIAIIVLLVAAVLIAVFTGVFGDTVVPGIKSLTACSARGDGAHCVTERSGCPDGTVVAVGCPETDADKSAGKGLCCIP